jgi:hypothetical protein
MSFIVDFLRDYLAFAKGNVPTIGIAISVLCLWLWSGFYSASIAEVRNRSLFFHLLLGMAFPLIYPLIILFALPAYVHVEHKKTEKKEKYTRAEGAPPVEAAPPVLSDAPPAMIDTQMMDNPDVAYDHGFFKHIALDSAGNARGPFTLSVKGESMKIEKIVECHNDFLMVEFVSSDGHVQKMRIPYKYIQGCTEHQS